MVCKLLVNWFALFLHSLHINIAMKMDLHFFCILIFGVHFSVAFLHFSSNKSFLVFSRKRQQPDHTTLDIQT